MYPPRPRTFLASFAIQVELSCEKWNRVTQRSEVSQRKGKRMKAQNEKKRGNISDSTANDLLTNNVSPYFLLQANILTSAKSIKRWFKETASFICRGTRSRPPIKSRRRSTSRLTARQKGPSCGAPEKRPLPRRKPPSSLPVYSRRSRALVPRLPRPRTR
jgi:hypothetical protein